MPTTTTKDQKLAKFYPGLCSHNAPLRGANRAQWDAGADQNSKTKPRRPLTGIVFRFCVASRV